MGSNDQQSRDYLFALKTSNICSELGKYTTTRRIHKIKQTNRQHYFLQFGKLVFKVLV